MLPTKDLKKYSLQASFLECVEDSQQVLKNLNAFLFGKHKIQEKQNLHTRAGEEDPHPFPQEHLNKSLQNLKQKLTNKLRPLMFSLKVSEYKPQSIELFYYMYCLIDLKSIWESDIFRILMLINLVLYKKREKTDHDLQKIVDACKSSLIKLGIDILMIDLRGSKTSDQGLTQNEDSSEKFKIALEQFIKVNEAKVSSSKYEICRICESHISINLMTAHLALCENLHQTNYIENEIVAKGKEILDEMKDISDPAELRDTRNSFNKVFEVLGETKVIFSIKEEIFEIMEFIQKHSDDKNPLISGLVDLLRKYTKESKKNTVNSGYESEGEECSRRSFTSSRKKFRKLNLRVTTNSEYNGSSEDSAPMTAYIKSKSQGNSVGHKYTFSDFQILSFLGKGSYCQVFLVRKRNTKDVYAMKVIDISGYKQEVLETLKKEQAVYKKIEGEHICKLFYSFSEQNLHFIVLEYEYGGSLRDLLDEEVYFTVEPARFYLANIFLAVASLHNLEIIHRDLKPENIVIGPNGHLKLTDFNLSILTKDRDEENRSDKFFGSPDYIAPEVIESKLKKHFVRDYWSIGIMAYELMVGVTPFRDMEVQDVFQNILKGEIEWPDIGHDEGMISPEAYDLIKSLLNPNPAERLGQKGLAEVKTHPFFKNFDWNLNNHVPFFIPMKPEICEEENTELLAHVQEQFLQTSAGSQTSFQGIIRYDSLKNQTTSRIRAVRTSQFKFQHDLKALKAISSTTRNYEKEQESESEKEIDIDKPQSAKGVDEDQIEPESMKLIESEADDESDSD